MTIPALRLVILLFIISAASSAAFAQADGTSKSTETTSAAAQDTMQPQRIRIGGNVQAAKLIRQPLPVYPQIAKTAHIEGTVVLHAIIAKDGSVQTVQYVSGPPLLMRAAMDAVKQWVYEPTTLQGQPVEVDTTISVVFTLGESSSGSAPPVNIDPQFRADALQMLTLTHAQERSQAGMRAMFDGLRPQLTASLPPTPNRDKIVSAYEEKLVALATLSEFSDAIVAVYARYFSDDDIKAMIQFYETPAGQHYAEHLGDVTADSVKAGQQLAANNLQRIFRELCSEYPELQGQANFCPASDKSTGQLRLPLPQTSESVQNRER